MSSAPLLEQFVGLDFEDTIARQVNGVYVPIFDDFKDVVAIQNLSNFDKDGVLRTEGRIVHIGIIATGASEHARTFLQDLGIADCFRNPRTDTDYILGAYEEVPYVTNRTYTPLRTFSQVLKKERPDPVPVQRKTRRVLDPKPHPDTMEYLLERSGVAPQNAIFIGNGTEDYELTKIAGVEFLIATAGIEGVRQLHKPTFAALLQSALNKLETKRLLS